MTRETHTDNPNPRRRQGLGRGLGALLGRSTPRTDEEVDELHFQGEEGGVRELPIMAIQANPHQPRARFGPGLGPTGGGAGAASRETGRWWWPES